jgi:hypothetical protein
MPQSILLLFKRFPYEVAAIGRLLAGYSTIELDLLNCVQVVGGNDFNTVFRAMFGKRGEARRVDEAEKLGYPDYDRLNLGADFQEAIEAVRHCLKIRNQYAHWVLWDDNSGNLALANLET